MKTSDQEQHFNLGAPGAGLPWSQRLVLKLFIGPIKSKISTWEESRAGFQSISDRIIKTIDSLSTEDLAKPVLVPPLPGIEDSSRNWSIAMTLEHICIAGRGICEITYDLSQNKKPVVDVQIKDTKPLGKIPPAQAISQFKSFCYSDVPKMETSIGNKKSKVQHYHPWFGSFDVHQWHWLLTAHQGLHLSHINEIKKKLFQGS